MGAVAQDGEGEEGGGDTEEEGAGDCGAERGEGDGENRRRERVVEAGVEGVEAGGLDDLIRVVAVEEDARRPPWVGEVLGEMHGVC